MVANPPRLAERWLQLLLPLLVLLAIALPVLTLHLGTYPSIWFDEGYRTSAARTIAQRGVYGTYTVNGYVPFDPGTSSGPTELLSLAANFSLLGASIVSARLVSVGFALVALAGIYWLVGFVYGREQALFATLLVVAMPAIDGVGFVLLGRQVLSEMPALALLVVGLGCWFVGWQGSRWHALAAGMLVGLGLLSKTQLALVLMPALALISLARGWRKPNTLLMSLLPLVVCVGVVGSWMLLARLSVSDAIRQENSVLLLDAIRSNLLTDLWGQNLGRGSLLIVAVMCGGILASVWQLWPMLRQRTPPSTAEWAQLTLALFLLCYIIWFAMLSVGWPRYAFAGLIIGLLPIGHWCWQVAMHWSRGWSARARWRWSQAITTLVAAVALLINFIPLLHAPQQSDAQRAGTYVSRFIPQHAIIETWEWELDALSNHWRFHHPDQRYLFEAIRQVSHHQSEPTLQYNLLQANPDYLIAGPFSDWLHIYSPEAVNQHFQLVATLGVYRVYERIR